jgi:hypothetical protein
MMALKLILGLSPGSREKSALGLLIVKAYRGEKTGVGGPGSLRPRIIRLRYTVSQQLGVSKK